MQHTDTYSAKSLQRMGYQLVHGLWKKKVSGQRINESSIDNDEETDEKLHSIEIGITAAEFTVPEAEVQEKTEREPPAPPMITSTTTTFAEASTSEPTVS